MFSDKSCPLSVCIMICMLVLPLLFLSACPVSFSPLSGSMPSFLGLLFSLFRDDSLFYDFAFPTYLSKCVLALSTEFHSPSLRLIILHELNLLNSFATSLIGSYILCETLPCSLAVFVFLWYYVLRREVCSLLRMHHALYIHVKFIIGPFCVCFAESS